jgi:hypothetical protein
MIPFGFFRWIKLNQFVFPESHIQTDRLILIPTSSFTEMGTRTQFDDADPH